MKSKIHYSKPSITNLEINYAGDAASNGWGENCYDYLNRFEESWKNHLGVEYAISTSSCTGALHMGLYALGVGVDDEVIIADTNWIATVAPILHLGAKPVLVDVSLSTWCIDIESIISKITPKTKAIIAVHLYGNMCDISGLQKISLEYDIPIIEDSAEAIGSEWKGKKAGSIGEFGTFSFHGTKTVTTGEGGMFVTNNSDLYEKVITLSNHGRRKNQSKQFWADELGFKYKMSNIQAAIGLAQTERIDELISKKREVFNLYKNYLSDQPLKLNPEDPDTKNGYWMPSIVVDEKLSFNSEDLIKEMKKENIDARSFFWPLSSLPMFTPVKENINSYNLTTRSMNLPSYHDLSIEEIERVVSVIKSFLSKCS